MLKPSYWSDREVDKKKYEVMTFVDIEGFSYQRDLNLGPNV